MGRDGKKKYIETEKREAKRKGKRKNCHNEKTKEERRESWNRIKKGDKRGRGT